MGEARAAKKERFVLKLDFAKAFNSVDWDYLLDMLGRMKFLERWVGWIRTCISTATANVLVNGSPSGEFELGRGLRQGDPLSPFLFLVAAEGLNLLTKRAIKEGLIKPTLVGRNKVEVSLIQYADNTVFVGEGSKENAVAIKWLLRNFKLLSGLKVNFEKNRVFGFNMGEGVLHGMAEELGYRVGRGEIPYLVMKVGGRLNGMAAWEDVVDKVKKKKNLEDGKPNLYQWREEQ